MINTTKSNNPKIYFLLIFGLFFILNSFGTNSSIDKNSKLIHEKPLGKWKDIIGLSTKQVYFNYKSDSIKITTKGNWWWIADINYVDSLSSNKPVHIVGPYQTKIIKGNFFKINKLGTNSLSVKFDTNSRKVGRKVVITLQAGNYFDYVTIQQLGDTQHSGNWFSKIFHKIFKK